MIPLYQDSNGIRRYTTIRSRGAFERLRRHFIVDIFHGNVEYGDLGWWFLDELTSAYNAAANCGDIKVVYFGAEDGVFFDHPRVSRMEIRFDFAQVQTWN